MFSCGLETGKTSVCKCICFGELHQFLHSCRCAFLPRKFHHVVITFFAYALLHASRHRNDGSDAFTNAAAFDENIGVERDKILKRVSLLVMQSTFDEIKIFCLLQKIITSTSRKSYETQTQYNTRLLFTEFSPYAHRNTRESSKP